MKRGIIFALAAVMGVSGRAMADEDATGVITLQSTGGTAGNPIYNYLIKVTNTGDQNLSTFWYAWMPSDSNFLVSYPTPGLAPSGWYGYVTGYGPSYGDGYGLEWYNLFGSPLTPGSTDSFGFSSSDNLQTLLGDAPSQPGTPMQTSYVYGGIGQSDSGATFVVTAAVAPAPEPGTLAVLGAGVLGWVRRRRRGIGK